MTDLIPVASAFVLLKPANVVKKIKGLSVLTSNQSVQCKQCNDLKFKLSEHLVLELKHF